MRRKRILHLITGLEIGGAEMMLLKTLPRLQDDFDNRVCCIRGHGPIGKRLESAGIPMYYLDLNHPLDLGIISRFHKVTRDFNPDILVTYLIHADLFGRIFGRLFGVRKVVCNQRGKLLQWEFLRIVDRATKSLVTRYIVQTKTARHELMKKLHLPEGRFEIIPNAINLGEFDFEIDSDKKCESLGLNPTDAVIITCVSKLRRGKGHEYLLKAFEGVFQGHPIARLLIVGDGEQREKLLEQVKGYQSRPAIHFLGNRNDVKEILKISDIFVLPTLGEGMSNAIMEAMASGLPIITTDIPENRELIRNNETGTLIPMKDSGTLAKAMDSLLNDSKKRGALGRNAQRDICERFSIKIVTSKLNQFFKSL